MDTEFPGLVTNDVGEVPNKAYATMSKNVNQLKLIQLGISLFNVKGESPSTIGWNFNFNFKEGVDQANTNSIELLKIAGIDFAKFAMEGINPQKFAEEFMVSGCVLTDDVTWIAFHGCFDFGFLIKVLLNQNLPEQDSEFISLQNLYFQHLYDIKTILQEGFPPNFSKIGLNNLAEQLKVPRIGTTHQAGSDAYLTGKVYFKLHNVSLQSINISEIKTKSSSRIYGIREQFRVGWKSQNLLKEEEGAMGGIGVYGSPTYYGMVYGEDPEESYYMGTYPRGGGYGGGQRFPGDGTQRFPGGRGGGIGGMGNGGSLGGALVGNSMLPQGIMTDINIGAIGGIGGIGGIPAPAQGIINTQYDPNANGFNNNPYYYSSY